MTRLAILGFGLIGGSIAQALDARRPGTWAITAWSRSAAAPQAALDAGLLSAVAHDAAAAARDADLTLLAASPRANIALVGRVGPAVVKGGGVLTDVSSVQAPMAVAAASVPGLRMVGGHPMSGRERPGYEAADPELFVDRPWVVVPGPAAGDSDLALVERLALDCGARPVRLEAAAHDAAVALISHLPLVVASALVETATGGPDWPLARSLAAQGWRDSTRVARGDPELGAGMLALNAANVAAALRRQCAVLDAWQVRLDALAAAGGDGPDFDALLVELERLAELARGTGGDGG
jgi:prephenate dehydrogenase